MTDVSKQDQSILVVDDEPAILRALTSALTARGYTVRQAVTGQSAIDMVAVDPPDAPEASNWIRGSFDIRARIPLAPR